VQRGVTAGRRNREPPGSIKFAYLAHAAPGFPGVLNFGKSVLAYVLQHHRAALHNQLDTKAQAWSALFSEPMSDLVKRYTSSVFFDKRMWKADITGSLAHAEMLAAQGHRPGRLRRHPEGHGPDQGGDRSRQFDWKLDLEDVHLNIEARLTAWWAMPASACTPAAAATTRWPPTCACGCATRST
jgi:hypothetical protein